MDEFAVLNSAITAILAVLGACAGSFINVVALRRSEGLSFITGRSRCPGCKRKLEWFELIPVISWLALFGRCRTCKARISPRYMIVELIGAAASASCFIRYWLTWNTVLALGVAVLLLAVAMIDITSMEIPNGLVIALIPFAIVSVLVWPDVSLISRGIGLVAASVPMLLLALIIDGAFGGGDVKLMAVCGVLLGWQNAVLALFIAVITAGVVALSLIVRRKAKRGAHIAFGPHLCFGVLAALLYGGELISWYLNLFGL